MDYSQLLSLGLSTLVDKSQSVFVFQAQNFSSIFFKRLQEQLKSCIDLDIKTIDIQTDLFLFKSQVQTSFLGMSCIYWLGNCSDIKQKQKDELLAFLSTYQGPHKIILFFDTKTEVVEQSSLLLVTFKDRYFYEDAQVLLITSEVKEESIKLTQFLRQIYKAKKSYTLDELILLQNYQKLLALECPEFYESWMTRLITPETSLFTLSQLLFEKNEKAFFKLWLQMKDLYSEMFWIAFWSDQMYRSYFFILFTQSKNMIAAKQVSFGLSFSFLKQMYKQYQLVELCKAHQQLFAIDTALKNGGNIYKIDQFYIDFFTGKFKS